MADTLTFPEAKPTAEVKPLVLGAETPPPKPEEKKPDEQPVVEQAKLAEAVRNSLKSRLRGQEPKKEEVKKEDEPAPEPKKEDVKAKEEEPPKRTARKPKEDSDALKIAAAAAETAKAALEISRQSRQEAPKATAQPPKPKVDPFSDVPEEYQEDIPILQAMEKKYPGKYTGIATKFAQSAVRASQYKKDWEKSNPGQEFDPAAESHNAFFEKNDVTWNDKDYSRAMAAIEAEALMEKDRKKNSQEIDKLKTRDVEREIEPTIHRAIGAASRSLMGNVDKEFEKLINEDGQIVRAEAERLRGSDPEKFEILMSEAQGLAKFIRETEKLFHHSNKFDFDDSNSVHKEIYDFTMAQEGYLKELPADKQRNENGQMFATRGEYASMSPEQRKRFWQLEKSDLQFLRGELSKDRAKKSIEAEEKRMEAYAIRRGFKPSNAPKDGKKDEAKIDEKLKPTAEKPSGPSGATGGKIASAASGDNAPPTDFKTLFKQQLKGR